MKLEELLSEALRANWTLADIRELTPKKFEALYINVKKANDEKVLDLWRQVYRERREGAEKAAEELEKQRQDWRRVHPPRARGVSQEILQDLANRIEDAVGLSVPDGDPIDRLIPYLDRNFGRSKYDYGKLLDRATKLIGKYKNYTDYLAQMWDLYTEVASPDTIDDEISSGEPVRRRDKRENPWR